MLYLTVFGSLVASLLLFGGGFGLLDELGRGGLATEEAAPAPPLLSPAGLMEREEEIRQLVQARHDRAVARGRAGLDVEREVSRLLELDVSAPPPDADAALREEVRQLVVARNERRAARGEPALDVEQEIDRQLRGLVG